MSHKGCDGNRGLEAARRSPALRIELVSADEPDPSSAHRERLESCLEIRREVFTLGQGVPEALEFDGLDEEADHLLALSTDGNAEEPIGTARMRVIEGAAKAERVAVRASERRLGVGRALMEAIERRARDRGCGRVVLNAQVAVLGFYEELGYESRGPVFEEAGIAHRAMEKRLR